MFTAVASPHAERVAEWLLKQGADSQPGGGRPRYRCDWFGCAHDGVSGGTLAGDDSSALVGTMRVEPIDLGVLPPPKAGAVVTQFEVARHLFAEHGLKALERLKGKFALVFCDRANHELIALRDPLGLAPLYYREISGTLLLADDVDALGAQVPFNPSYIARFITSRGNPHTTSTIREGVQALPPGTWLRWRNGAFSTGRFWSAEDVSVQHISLRDASSRFRDLLHASVSSHIDAGARTWAHLSGGLDSSSVVSIAAGAREGQEPLGGTLTFRDSLANGDDTEFVNTVLERYGLTNITISDRWPWCRDDLGPPLTDRPSRDYPLYARDREVAHAVAAAGGSSLLSGIGPDVYLPHTAAHCSDLVWSGQILTALKELHAWTVATRGSLWRVGIHHGFLPLVARTSPALELGLSRVPEWFTADFRRRYAIRRLLVDRQRLSGRRGRYYCHQVATNLSGLAARLSNWHYNPGIEMRHPLLHQRLVEFCLTLPWKLRTDVYWPKPVLRSAMKGILPDKVRMRVGGSLLAPRVLWAFRHEQKQLQQLLQAPVLADLGFIEPSAVRQALESFDVYRSGATSHLYALLSLETWLSAKSGRWSHGGR